MRGIKILEPFEIINSPAIPLMHPNINTDVIMPSREMRKVERKGLHEGLFADWRYLPQSRTPDTSFIMNDKRFENARIILGGSNFGCGSSREFAVWGLYDYNIRVIIASSFGDIFFKNCVLNGILPATIDQNALKVLHNHCLDASPIIINLKIKTIGYGENLMLFDIDNSARKFLLQGLDQIERTRAQSKKIDAFIAADKVTRSWVY